MPMTTSTSATSTAIFAFAGILLWNIASSVLSPGHTPTRDNEDVDNDDDVSNTMYDAVRVEYRDMATWYDNFWRSYTNATLKLPLSIVITTLLQVVQQTTSFVLVDVGCGTGSFLRCLVDRLTTIKVGIKMENIHLIGAEPSKEMLEVARKKLINVNDESVFTTTCKVSLENCAAERLLLNNDIADVIVSTNAFHFFRKKRRSLLEMQRVLKPKGGGTIIIVDWCADYTIVQLYHLLFERMRWNWRRFGHEYPSPLTSVEFVNLVESIPGLQVIQHSCYQVRVYSIFHWGMQSIIIRRID
jgi:ubiquinone/menaquinone biosynthesis C-methylase UbiE